MKAPQKHETNKLRIEDILPPAPRSHRPMEARIQTSARALVDWVKADKFRYCVSAEDCRSVFEGAGFLPVPQFEERLGLLLDHYGKEINQPGKDGKGRKRMPSIEELTKANHRKISRAREESK